MENHLRKLTDFLEKLDNKGIDYTLSAAVRTSIMVIVALPGERWEVNYFDDGDIGVEVFKSDGTSYSEEKLSEILLGVRKGIHASAQDSSFPRSAWECRLGRSAASGQAGRRRGASKTAFPSRAWERGQRALLF
jgi:hypothetical protein